MNQAITHPASRARRIIALAKSYVHLIGLPANPLTGNRDVSTRGLAVASRIDAAMGRDKKTPKVAPRIESARRRVVYIPKKTEDERADEARARIGERERIARIVRYGIERNVVAFAAAFAFETSMSCDRAFRLIDKMTKSTSNIN